MSYVRLTAQGRLVMESAVEKGDDTDPVVQLAIYLSASEYEAVGRDVDELTGYIKSRAADPKTRHLPAVGTLAKHVDYWISCAVATGMVEGIDRPRP